MTTGGFGANKEMLRKYYPDFAEYFWNCASESTGEGIEMVLGAGSKIECVFCNYFLEKVAERFGESCISKMENVAAAI